MELGVMKTSVMKRKIRPLRDIRKTPVGALQWDDHPSKLFQESVTKNPSLMHLIQKKNTRWCFQPH